MKRKVIISLIAGILFIILLINKEKTEVIEFKTNDDILIYDIYCIWDDSDNLIFDNTIPFP